MSPTFDCTAADVLAYGEETWPLVADIIGVRLICFMTGKTKTSQLHEWSEPQAERLWWVWRICLFMTSGEYAWDRVTLSSWWMGMNPFLGEDHYNNPATFIRDGRFRDVWQAAQHDHIL